MSWATMTRDEKRAAITDGVRAGKSGSQIAAGIQNCTKNKVLGWANRHGVKMMKPNNLRANIVRKAHAKPRPTPLWKPYRLDPLPHPVGWEPSLAVFRTVLRVVRLHRPETVHIPGPTGGVLFLARRPAECAWLLPETDGLPVEERRCCGAPVPQGARRAFCPEHDAICVSVVPVSRGVKRLLEAA